MATRVSPAPLIRSASVGVPATDQARDAADRRFVLLLLVIFVVHLATATWSPPVNVDSFTNMLQARAFAADQSHVVADAEHLLTDELRGRVTLLVDAPDGPTSQYPPGVALWGSLFYLIEPGVGHIQAVYTTDAGGTGTVDLAVPAFAPGAMAAVVATTLAMLFLGLTLRSVVSEDAMVVTVAVVAFGTGVWSVASDQLWQHSPGIMCIALGLLLASRDRFAGSGLAFAAAALIRPHTAIIAAGIGCAVALRRRQWGPMLRMGFTSALGVVGVVAYNAAVWGEPSISGGYGDTFSDRVVSTSPLVLGSRLVASLVHPGYGVGWSSPFVLVALVAVVAGTRRGPDWAVGAAIGGFVYALVQYQANRVSGGNHIFGYRYPLEPLMAAAPLLTASTVALLARHKSLRVGIAGLAVASVLAHGYGAVFVTA